jgi:hypothetical protein
MISHQSPWGISELGKTVGQVLRSALVGAHRNTLKYLWDWTDDARNRQSQCVALDAS